ncbi:CD3324 family protein [Oceanirhabdus sp. W0125-5]|uniref:CD3324 family protein n=1 Tax=Oceanirhabdus sp. W0125-5 TaxID=2999116 RepID=UPI0022F33360|nr:CD3324 family protein [Oceanirhabdus sp. W0125-5]WBW98595.1 CD3324 family protein [Oceanirhabdus sp. W0125-5]
MSYVKATEVLPQEVLDIIQKYIEGEYIYIPRKKCNRKAWGESTKSKNKTAKRNSEIYRKYQEGTSIKELSEMYYLAPKSIQKIISKIKRETLQRNAS